MTPYVQWEIPDPKMLGTVTSKAIFWYIPWKIGQKYMVGSSNKSLPEVTIDYYEHLITLIDI